MDLLCEALSSKAKFSVLSVLATSSSKVSLRELSRLTDISIFSIEGAVKNLTKLDLIEDQKNQRYRLLSFNQKHSYASLIKSIFELIQKSKPFDGKINLQTKARECLRFSDQMIKMVRKAKT